MGEVGLRRRSGSEDLVATLLQNPSRRILAIEGGPASGVGRRVWSIRKGRQLEVVVTARDDVEGPPGRDLNDGSEGPITEEFAAEAFSPELARLIDAAEDEAVALIEQRIGTIQSRVKTVLGSSGGLQIRRIVNRVRPGVGTEEFVVPAEALAQVDREPVIDGTAVGEVGVHVSEGNAACEGRRIARRVEARETVSGCLELLDDHRQRRG